MAVMAFTLAISCFLGIEYVLELGATSATIVLCVSFMNYMYLVLTLLGEDGGHGDDTNDILLPEQVLELSETSAYIVLCVSFMKYLYQLRENDGHGFDIGNISLTEHVLELIDTNGNIVRRNFLN
jgi:hypothetical protein